MDAFESIVAGQFPTRPAIPARLIEDRRYAEQLAELKRQHPDWHVREGQALRWEGDDN